MAELEYFGRGGSITSHLRGRIFDIAKKDGPWLRLRMDCGHEYRVGFQDAKGNQVQGEPFINALGTTVFPMQAKGLEVDFVFRDEFFVGLQFTNGRMISWGIMDVEENPVRADPFLENQDVTILLPSAGLTGEAT